MNKYIKYKRIYEKTNDEEIQSILDNLIVEGWEIIYYNESNKNISITEVMYSDKHVFHVTILAGKKNQM